MMIPLGRTGKPPDKGCRPQTLNIGPFVPQGGAGESEGGAPGIKILSNRSNALYNIYNSNNTLSHNTGRACTV